jgi:hypothetical protein
MIIDNKDIINLADMKLRLLKQTKKTRTKEAVSMEVIQPVIDRIDDLETAIKNAQKTVSITEIKPEEEQADFCAFGGDK